MSVVIGGYQWYSARDQGISGDWWVVVSVSGDQRGSGECQRKSRTIREVAASVYGDQRESAAIREVALSVYCDQRELAAGR